MSEELVERTESRQLFCLLKRFVGDEDVSLKTLGGFAFIGRLISVNDNLAFLTDVKVFSPGLPFRFCLNSVTVNLETLTAVGIGD